MGEEIGTKEKYMLYKVHTPRLVYKAHTSR